MSETVKLIIEISKETYDHVCDIFNRLPTPKEEIEIEDSIRNCTPLDDVKAEIKTFTIAEKSKYDRGFNEAVLKCFNALDNIGKGDEECQE